jgi:hypothetical protein
MFQVFVRTVKFFKPDYETAIIEGYKRPVIGLILCRKCWVLRYWSASSQMPHHDDLESLKASASGACWLCKMVYRQLLSLWEDLENPPIMELPYVPGRKSHRLVIWFAERTRTRSGFLDDLRGKSISVSISASAKVNSLFQVTLTTYIVPVLALCIKTFHRQPALVWLRTGSRFVTKNTDARRARKRGFQQGSSTLAERIRTYSFSRTQSRRAYPI